MYGELVPVGGGDTIPLLKARLLVGRRESCDIKLRFPNVSAHHCELELRDGYWYIRDLNSRNGVKVNGMRVAEKLLQPGDALTIARHKFEVQYSPADLGAVGPPPDDNDMKEMFGKSLLQRAGLESSPREAPAAAAPQRMRDVKSRFEVLNNNSGQIKAPGAPL
jgi:adenylate cyclase